MSQKSISSLEIPVEIETLKFCFFMNENIRVCGHDGSSIPHNHGKYFELRYVSSGHCVQVINDSKLKIQAGDWVLIYPDENHYQPINEISENLIQYSFRFFIKPPTKSASLQQNKRYTAMIKMLHTLRLSNDKEFNAISIWERLTQEFIKKEYGYFSYLQALCSILFTEFLRLAQNNANLIQSADELKYNFRWREQIDHLLRHRYMEPLRLKDFAQAMQVSERQASRIFIREFGIPYIKKLMETRLQQAKFQLKYTNKNLHQISTDCGFQNYNYFSNCFRKETGLTPAAYRSKVKEDDEQEKS